MLIILMLVFIVFMVVSIRFRMIVCHPISCLCYACSDMYYYYKYHQYDVFYGGHLNSYVAHFGGGKTLTMVHDTMRLYKRYNNKRIFDKKRGIWVTQKILVLSNVVIKGCENYQHLDGLKQVVECCTHNEVLDMKHNTKTCVIVIIDEASVMLNSRSFKDNIDYGFLNKLLTCRHYSIDLYYTSQKQNLVDKLLRDVTQKVIHCDKKWRLVVNRIYDADEVEKAGSLTLISPLGITGYIATNDDYNAYDTYAVVKQLEKSTLNGDMLTEQEILANRGSFYTDIDSIERPSKKLIRRRKSS